MDKDQRSAFHTPMFLEQCGKLHYEPNEGYGKVEINAQFRNGIEDTMMLDILMDWIAELENWRVELHNEVYPIEEKAIGEHH